LLDSSSTLALSLLLMATPTPEYAKSFNLEE